MIVGSDDLTSSYTHRNGWWVVHLGLCSIHLPSFGLALVESRSSAQSYSHLSPPCEFVRPIPTEGPNRLANMLNVQFFSTSLTWSRALQVPLYLCAADKEWYQRADDIKPSDQIIWWSDTVSLGPNVSLVQCGGYVCHSLRRGVLATECRHFPGSSILHWDRLSEPAPSADNLPTKPTPVSGIIFTADTLMVMPTQSQFTFIWSAPNMVCSPGPFRLHKLRIDPASPKRRVERGETDRTSSLSPGHFYLAREIHPSRRQEYPPAKRDAASHSLRLGATRE